MRHQNTKAKLNRTASHRKALMMNLTRALVEHKKITTTLAKAKAARSFAEKLITHAKKDDVASRRQVLKKLRSRDAVHTLFHEIGPRYRDRNGGYTRIIKLENRGGDNSPMAILELVGFAVDEPAQPTRRRRRQQAQRKPAAKATAPKTEAGKKDAAEVPEAPVTEAQAEEQEMEATASEAVEEKKDAGEAQVESADTPDAAAEDDADEKKAESSAESDTAADEDKDDEDKKE